MKYIKLYDNRHDFVFDEQRYFPNTALVNGEDEPSYFTDVEEVVFELTVTLPTEKVVTGQTYTLAVEYGGADVFSEATVTTTGDVTLNGTQFTANTDGDFSVTATYDGKTVTLNGTSKLMTAAPTISFDDSGCGIYRIAIGGDATKTITFNDEEFTPSQNPILNFKEFYADLTAQTVVVTATAQETGKWESDAATATYTIPVLQTLTASISDNTLEDGETAQMTVMYGNQNVTEHIGIMYTASGDVTCTNGNVMHQGAGVVTAAYSTGSGSIVVSSNGGYGNPNLTPITINVTVAQAAQNIVFADNDVKSIVANAFGSNGEITTAQAAAVTQWFEGGYNNTSTNPFCKNANVDSFDEFAYFTGVTEIGADAFQDCFNMQSITLPSSLTYIPDYTFSGCSSLDSVTIPAAVTSIGNQAFNGCSSLESMTIPAAVTYIGNRVFNVCNNLTYISVDSSNSYFNDGNGSNVIIDNNGNLLYGGRACTVIPNTVNSIGDYAFSGRSLLNNTMIIPSSVSSIGRNAFSGTALTSVTFGSYLESIGNYSFNGTYLTSVTIPDSVTYIGNYAFNECSDLASVTIGNSVTTIGISAFANCTSLTSVTIPASVTSIGNQAFYICRSLTSITCEATTPPTFVKGTNAWRVFTGNENLVIYVPAASVDTYKAAEIWSNYADRIQAIGGGGDEPEPGKNIVFADPDVKAIVANAYGSNGEITEEQAAAVTTWFSGTDSSINPFYQNTDVDSFDELRYFTSVSEIGDNTFENCSNMTSIIIPSSVTSIGNRAVRGCRSLTRVICEATVPPTLGSGVFGTTNGCPLYVPEESLDGYKAAPNWSTYASRIQPFGVTVSLPTENIVTGYKYNLNVTYNGGDVLSNATITSTGDVTINGSGFTANSDGAFSITATYNGYTATLNGTASTPQYAVVALDCSELEDANPLEFCANCDPEGEVPEGLNTLDCMFDGEVSYVENGVITIPTNGSFGSFSVDADYERGGIVYVKLTHPSAEYKFNADTTVLNHDFFTWDVTFDSTTLTTTISNVVPLDNVQFDGSNFELINGGETPIKITRIEVGYVPTAEEEEEPAEE